MFLGKPSSDDGSGCDGIIIILSSAGAALLDCGISVPCAAAIDIIVGASISFLLLVEYMLMAVCS